MIPRRTLQGIAVVGVLTVISFWLNRDGGENVPAGITELDTRLNYALRDFEALYYDPQGKLAGKVTAPRLANDAETGIARIEKPRFQVVHEGQRWTILSESAIVTPDREHVLFAGQVDLLGRESDPDRDVRVKTSDATLEITPRMVRSAQDITILEGPNTLNANGFELDMTNNRFHLDSLVEGSYATR